MDALANGKPEPCEDKASSECTHFPNNISALAILNICSGERASLFGEILQLCLPLISHMTCQIYEEQLAGGISIVD